MNHSQLSSEGSGEDSSSSSSSSSSEKKYNNDKKSNNNNVRDSTGAILIARDYEALVQEDAAARTGASWDLNAAGEWDENHAPTTTTRASVPVDVRSFDTARIYIESGTGGDGVVAFKRLKYNPNAGPCGGNGGKGGDVWIVADGTMTSLRAFRRKVHHKSGAGGRGGGKDMSGAAGEDVEIRVPVGTVVWAPPDAPLNDEAIYDAASDVTTIGAGTVVDVFDDDDSSSSSLVPTSATTTSTTTSDFQPRPGAVKVVELLETGARHLLAAGGRGGRGNASFKTGKNKAPQMCEKGEAGTNTWLDLELKLCADAGIVGCPNAGKSTLLASLSNADPKIGAYPFTTLVPNLGVCEDLVPAGAEPVVFADIPGLLEGAHVGRGLGREFLRHIERCRVLVHLVDGTSPDPVGDFVAISNELALFSDSLATKPRIVFVSKIDQPECQEFWAEEQSRWLSDGIDETIEGDAYENANMATEDSLEASWQSSDDAWDIDDNDDEKDGEWEVGDENNDDVDDDEVWEGTASFDTAELAFLRRMSFDGDGDGEVPALPPPLSLRAACARFGAKLSPMPISGLARENVRDVVSAVCEALNNTAKDAREEEEREQEEDVFSDLQSQARHGGPSLAQMRGEEDDDEEDLWDAASLAAASALATYGNGSKSERRKGSSNKPSSLLGDNTKDATRLSDFKVLCITPGGRRSRRAGGANTWVVRGSSLERFVQMTNWEYYEAAKRFHEVLKQAGVWQSLSKSGAREGDTVFVGEFEFEWKDAVMSTSASTARTGSRRKTRGERMRKSETPTDDWDDILAEERDAQRRGAKLGEAALYEDWLSSQTRGKGDWTKGSSSWPGMSG